LTIFGNAEFNIDVRNSSGVLNNQIELSSKVGREPKPRQNSIHMINSLPAGAGEGGGQRGADGDHTRAQQSQEAKQSVTVAQPSAGAPTSAVA
jgi:hypothetical protein